VYLCHRNPNIFATESLHIQCTFITYFKSVYGIRKCVILYLCASFVTLFALVLPGISIWFGIQQNSTILFCLILKKVTPLHYIYNVWVIMFLTDCKQDKESEKIVKCLLLEIRMYSKASWMALVLAAKIVCFIRETCGSPPICPKVELYCSLPMILMCNKNI
jgi:hypothetical protein